MAIGRNTRWRPSRPDRTTPKHRLDYSHAHLERLANHHLTQISHFPPPIVMKSYFRPSIIAALLLLLNVHSTAAQETTHGTVVTEHLTSTVLQGTITGVDPNRTIKIYLPPGYAASNKAYPVVYYLHSINWNG